MEKLNDKIEQFVEKQIAAFEESPIATSLKILIVLWVFKQIYRELRK